MRKSPRCNCTRPISLTLYKGNTILACQPGSQEEQNSQLHLTGGWTETSPAANTHTHTGAHKQTNKASHIWMQSDNQEDWHLHKQTVWHTFGSLHMMDSEVKTDFWLITFPIGKSRLWCCWWNPSCMFICQLCGLHFKWWINRGVSYSFNK